MIQDEFNKVEITNDKQLLKVEFGKTQKVEFTSKKENEIPEGDLNEKYVGKTIKKVTEVNVDYVNKVPTHATQTVVTTSTTATSAGAAAAATAVTASTVAVVAIATATGISVALHDYYFEFQSFIISSNELTYCLTVFDRNDDKTYLSYEESDEPSSSDLEEEYDPFKEAPFILKVSNYEYSVSKPVFYHLENEGVFENLVLGETYNITLTENRYGGETIYKDVFVTYSTTEFNDFTISGSCDIKDNFFEVNMDFIDKTDAYSNFSIVLFDPELPEEIRYTFPLEKQAGNQYVTTLDENNNPMIDYTRTWGYEFSYVYEGETINFKQGTVSFEDWQGRKSNFNEFVFDKTANFVENSITVKLDYQDDFNWYKDFSLKLTLIPSEEEGGNQTGGDNPEQEYYSQNIPLQATTDNQTIVLNEYEMYVRDSYFKYTYSLSCKYRDEEIILAEETEPFTFTDNSNGIKRFNSFTFTKQANFINKSFKVTLDYQDDFNDYEDFKLTLYPNGENAQYDFNLVKTKDEQTLTFDPDKHHNFSMDYEYSYVLTCMDYFTYEEIELERSEQYFTFTDISGGRAEFNGVTFTGEYEISTGKAPVKLDFIDEYGDYLSDFVLHVSAPIVNQQGGDGPNPLHANTGDAISADDYPYTFYLQATTEVQYISLYESEIPTSLDAEYKYAITYKRHGVDQEPFVSTSQIAFNDPDAESVVNGITFVNGEANFNDRSFYVQLDFQDDYGYFRDFVLQVWDATNGGYVNKELEYTTEPQLVVIDEFDNENNIYPVDIIEGDLTYNFNYVTSETGDPSTQYFYEQSQPLSFTNSLKSEFYGLDTTFDITEVSSDFYTEYRLPFRFDMVNDAEYFSAPELYVTSLDDDENILATFAFQNETMDSGWQYGTFAPYNSNFTLEQLTNGDEYNLVVACYEKDGYNGSDSRAIKYNEPHSFTLNQNKEICGVNAANYIVYGEWKAYFTLIGNGDFETFENGQIIFESAEDGTTLTYDLTLTENLEVDLLSPKDRTTTEQFINDFFTHRVNATFKYSKPGSEEIITLDCLSNFLFSISN